MSSSKKRITPKLEPFSPSFNIALKFFQRSIHKSKNFRSGLAQARRQTLPIHLPKIINSLSTNKFYKDLFVVSTFPTEINFSNPKGRLNKISMDGEFIWNCSILSLYTNELKAFIIKRDIYYSEYLLENYENAEKILNDIQDDFGHSLWLIRQKLQLLQVTKGVQAQKNLLEKVVTDSGFNDIQAWLIYHLSIRAEDNISYDNFKDELNVLLNRNNELSSYIRLKLLPYEFQEIDSPDIPINWEEPNCLIDRLETFIPMILVYTAKLDKNSINPTLKNTLRLLKSINDPILNNIINIINADISGAEQENIKNLDSYTIGDYKSVIEANSTNIELLVKAFALSNTRPDSANLKNNIISKMYEIIISSPIAKECEIDLKKIALFLFGSNISYQIISFLESEKDFIFTQNYSINNKVTALVSDINNPQYSLLLDEVYETNLIRYFKLNYSNSLTMNLLYSVLNSDINGVLELEDKIPEYRLIAYTGHIHLRNKNYLKAIEKYKLICNSKNEYINLNSQLYLFEAYFLNNNFYQCMYLVIDHIIRIPSILPRYPIERLAKLCLDSFIDSGEIGLVILLHIAANNINDEFFKEISDSFENFLWKHNISVPSQIERIKDSISNDHLIYFLRYVCVQNILDDLTIFNSVEEIEEERIKICQLLLKLDPQNESIYLSEIRIITRDIKIAHLLKQIQTSKIYVDESAIRRILEPKLRSSLTRYQQLLDSPNLAYQAEKLSKRLNEILSHINHEYKDLKLPASELESLFTTMLTDVISEFALNPAYGLDTHVSTTIRHGAFEGNLRSPLASEDLLCIKKEKGKDEYILSSGIMQKVSHLHTVQLNNLQKYLTKFTIKFNELIDSYLKEKLHINNHTYKNGLFSFEATAEENQLLMDFISDSTDYESLIDKFIQHCWDHTTKSLENIQKTLKVDFTTQMNSAFDTLIKNIQGGVISVHDNNAELLDSIARARTKFYSAIEDVAGWFQIPKDLTREEFEVDLAIGVALEQIKNCYVDRPVLPILDIAASNKIDGNYFDGLCGIIFILVQNVIIHNGKEGCPIEIKLSAKIENNNLLIKCENILADTISITECKDQAENAMKLYADDSTLHRARKEGGSGLSKVWRIGEYELKKQHSIRLEVSDEKLFTTELYLRDMVN